MDWWLLVLPPCIASVLSLLCGCSLTCLGGKVNNMCNFEKNREELRRELAELLAKRDGVLSRVTAEELEGRQRLPNVDKWLLEVQAIETDTKQLIDDASAEQQRLATTSGCCWSTDHMFKCFHGEEVFNKLIETKGLSGTEFKEFQEVTEKTPPPVVQVKVVHPTFGLDRKLERTWESLMKDRMLGIYGMGGVGKTTLLTLINNKFDEVQVKKDFDVVIWVADVGKIQDVIGKRLGIDDEEWDSKSQKEKARDIRWVLIHTKPRFVLLLDDLWEPVSLTDIGIPLMGRGYKVVFTTRSKDVCGRMGANEDIQVECLAEKDAWDLFKQKARCGGLNEQVLYIAKKIARGCCGLPLALEVIGRTLASKTTVEEWGHALNTLASYPSALDNGILQVLILSYDYLGRKDAQLCFQYCALFPKAYYITRDELVEYWIGEGFIDVVYRGYALIDTLVQASLLLKDGESEQRVYMHDVIREMALWIVSKSDKGERFVVNTGVGLRELPKFNNWKSVTKISLMDNEIESIPDSPLLPDLDGLVTLFLQNNKLVDIAGEFFLAMSALLVLDLSGNPALTKLPEEIKKLVDLRYLNLSGTGIKDLPSGFGELRKLIHLDLESTPNLGSISLVSKLWKLQVLRFYGSKASLDRSLREKLEHSNYIEILTITVRKAEDLKGFLGSKLVGKTQGLYLEGLEVSGATLGEMGSLGKLEMVNCEIIESETEWKRNKGDQYSPSTSSNPITPSNVWFKNLSVVVLSSCKGLKDVTWLIYAANLESLSIKTSPELEEVISKEKAAGVNVEEEPFRKLQVVDLGYLSELKSIYWTSLLFPKLKKVNIINCPKLRKLPLNSTSVERIDDLRIQVDEGWLDGIIWESEATQERFKPLIVCTGTASVS